MESRLNKQHIYEIKSINYENDSMQPIHKA